MLATGAQQGDIAKRTDVVKTFILSATPRPPSATGSTSPPPGTVDSAAGPGPSSRQDWTLGSGNADNTRDANSLISNRHAGRARHALRPPSVPAHTGTATAGFVPKVQGDLCGMGSRPDRLRVARVPSGTRCSTAHALGETGATGLLASADGTSGPGADQRRPGRPGPTAARRATRSASGTVGGNRRPRRPSLQHRRSDPRGRPQTRLYVHVARVRHRSPAALLRARQHGQCGSASSPMNAVRHRRQPDPQRAGADVRGSGINVGAGQEYDSPSSTDLYIWNCGGNLRHRRDASAWRINR